MGNNPKHAKGGRRAGGKHFAKRRRRSAGLSSYRRVLPIAGAAAALIIIVVAIIISTGRPDSVTTAGGAYPSPEPTAVNPHDPKPSTPEVPSTPGPTPTVAPTPSPTPAGPRTATILSIGDIVMHDALIKSAYSSDSETFDFLPMFEMVSHIMEDADYTVINVEGALCGDEKESYKGYPRFNTPVQLIPDLIECGVDMMTLANNHALDMYFTGLKQSIDNMEKYGMDFVGAARTKEESQSLKIVDLNGINVGFLNYTTGTNGMERHCDTAVKEYGVNYTGRADYAGDVKRLREAGADVVVVYMHWGNEYERKSSNTQRSMARKIAAAGADVIVGSHPHVVQPVEWVDGKAASGETNRCLCLYSMGNFLSNQPERYRDAGIMFRFTISEREDGTFEITEPTYIPTYYWRRGSEKNEKGILAKVVPCGEWLDSRPEDMSDTSYNRLLQVWDETQKLLDSKVAQSG